MPILAELSSPEHAATIKAISFLRGPSLRLETGIIMLHGRASELAANEHVRRAYLGG
jgi:hypothetical protein